MQRFVFYLKQMNNVRKTLTLLAGLAGIALGEVAAQGCVAIRSQSCMGNVVTGGTQTGVVFTGDMVASAGYRYFRSFRHYRGKHEEPHRVAEGTEVINLFHGIDLGFTYGITDRFSGTLIVPFAINDRSSLYEHYGNSVTANPNRNRFHTYSAGLGDVRLTGNYWLLDQMSPGNAAVGVTVKFPTGKTDVTDEFHRLNEAGEDYVITQPVDQSIQLGDGAFGFGLEVQGYQSLFSSVSMYYNASYLLTPRNINNTLRRANLDPADPFNYFSSPDQYAARLGLVYSPVRQISINFGGRIEGIPSADLIGKSEGFRRPGYAISVEPGVSVLLNRFAVNVNVPVAVDRNRVQSTQDKLRSTPTNTVIGDAAFADYVINVAVSYQISKPQPLMLHH